MRVIVAPGPFKGSLDASEAARAMEAGVLRVLPGCRVDRVPLADGGAGTVAALVAATGGRKVAREVTGPLGTKVQACLGLLPAAGAAVVEAGQAAGAAVAEVPQAAGAVVAEAAQAAVTAVAEVAQAAGLALVPPGQADPLQATTYGVGELLRLALDAGCTRLVVGLGDSATVDGGLGALEALGLRALDAAGRPVGRGGGALSRVAVLDLSGLDPRLAWARVVAAADVDNPLLGPRGAARAFGPQKGATPGQVEELEAGLCNWARLIEAHTGRKVADLPGAGAAGGLGAGLAGVLGAEIRSGVELVLDAAGLERRLPGADLVLTGEGRLDGQTLRGKVVLGVAARARRAGVPVVAVVGSRGEDAAPPEEYGLDAVFVAYPGPVPLAWAMERARELVEVTVEQVMRVLALGGRRAAAGGTA